jgi:hypothetical protein
MNRQGHLGAVVAVFAAMATGSCGYGSGALMPSPSTSEYFKTTGCGFVVSRENKEIVEGITLAPTKPLPPGAVVVAEFENPSNRDAPLKATYTAKGDETTIVLKSPPMKGLKVATYRIVVSLYADSTETASLARHEQLCRSIIDQEQLPGY